MAPKIIVALMSGRRMLSLVFIANTYIGGFRIPFRPAPQTIRRFLPGGPLCIPAKSPAREEIFTPVTSTQVLAPLLAAATASGEVPRLPRVRFPQPHPEPRTE